jgi:hypothetical protein
LLAAFGITGTGDLNKKEVNPFLKAFFNQKDANLTKQFNFRFHSYALYGAQKLQGRFQRFPMLASK